LLNVPHDTPGMEAGVMPAKLATGGL